MKDLIRLEHPSEFLATFSADSFNDPKKIKYIETLLKSKKAVRIGVKSGFGGVYSINNGEYAIKVNNICTASENSSVKSLCMMAREGDIVYHVPDSQSGKTIIFAPNYLLEPVIGLVLNGLLKDMYTSSIVKTLSFVYDDKEKVTYTLMETMESLNNHIFSQSTFLYMIFQVMYTLNVAQKTHRYVHFDLHADNIMARPLPPNEINIYPLPDGQFAYTMFSFDTVLIDFGFNRIETSDYILTPRLIFEKKGTREFVNFYAFNPYYDIFAFLYSVYKKGMINNKFSNMPKDKIEFLSRKLFSVLLRVSEDEAINEMAKLAVNPKHWRPAVELLNNTSSASEMLMYVVKLFEMSHHAYDETEKEFKPTIDKSIMPDSEIINILKSSGFVVLPTIKRLDGYKSNIFKAPSIVEKMDTTFYPYIEDVSDSIDKTDFIRLFHSEKGIAPPGVRTSILPFNTTISQASKAQGHLKNQWTHIAYIDPVQGNKNGYKFNFECCRIDLKNYFQTEKIKAGVAINTTFFKIGASSNYTPIGLYKSEDILMDNAIPTAYEKYFRYIVIRDDGMLDIVSANEARNYRYISAAGAVLIEGDFQFNEKMIETDRYNSPLSQYCVFKKSIELTDDAPKFEIIENIASTVNSMSDIEITEQAKSDAMMGSDDIESILKNLVLTDHTKIDREVLLRHINDILDQELDQEGYIGDVDKVREELLQDMLAHEQSYKQELINTLREMLKTGEIMCHTFHNSYIWQCRKAENKQEELQLQFKDNKLNCSIINPGVLSHASNPNPRSALCIDDKNGVYMVYIEGRDERGMGMDFAQLAQFCKGLSRLTGRHIVKAINLDGGRSSHIVWHKEGENQIRITNNKRASTYPNGAILSYIKV